MPQPQQNGFQQAEMAIKGYMSPATEQYARFNPAAKAAMPWKSQAQGGGNIFGQGPSLHPPQGAGGGGGDAGGLASFVGGLIKKTPKKFEMPGAKQPELPEAPDLNLPPEIKDIPGWLRDMQPGQKPNVTSTVKFETEDHPVIKFLKEGGLL